MHKLCRKRDSKISAEFLLFSLLGRPCDNELKILGNERDRDSHLIQFFILLHGRRKNHLSIINSFLGNILNHILFE